MWYQGRAFAPAISLAGKTAGACKREPPVTGVTDGPHTKNMNTKTVTNIHGFFTRQARAVIFFHGLIPGFNISLFMRFQDEHVASSVIES